MVRYGHKKICRVEQHHAIFTLLVANHVHRISEEEILLGGARAPLPGMMSHSAIATRFYENERVLGL